MNNLRRLLRNVPVLMLIFALVATAAPAFAAENLGGGAAQSPELPAGLSPEQADMIRKMLQNNAEARKALEAAQQQKDNTAQQQKDQAAEQIKKAAEAEADATKKEPATKPEGAAAAATAKAELAAPVRYDWRTSAYVGPLFANRLTPQERDSLKIGRAHV